jgi:hypothetical protein
VGREHMSHLGVGGLQSPQGLFALDCALSLLPEVPLQNIAAIVLVHDGSSEDVSARVSHKLNSVGRDADARGAGKMVQEPTHHGAQRLVCSASTAALTTAMAAVPVATHTPTTKGLNVQVGVVERAKVRDKIKECLVIGHCGRTTRERPHALATAANSSDSCCVRDRCERVPHTRKARASSHHLPMSKKRDVCNMTGCKRMPWVLCGDFRATKNRVGLCTQCTTPLHRMRLDKSL